MGSVLCHGTCFSCKQLFSFNPHKVPSIPIEGVRREICRDCVESVNPERIAKGLDPIVIRDGAYEPMPEEEL